MKILITSKFRINSLTKYEIGSAVEAKLSSPLPKGDIPNEWERTAIGNITIMLNDPVIIKEFTDNFGKEISVAFAFDEFDFPERKEDKNATKVY